MSHYTLLSGKDTSTCTFKCDGCGVRFPVSFGVLTDTPHRWNAMVCSPYCIPLADKKYDSMLLLGKEEIREIVEFSSNGKYTFNELYAFIKRLQRTENASNLYSL